MAPKWFIDSQSDGSDQDAKEPTYGHDGHKIDLSSEAIAARDRERAARDEPPFQLPYNPERDTLD